MYVQKFPAVAPPPTYAITGLTTDEVVFLRDLVGKFSSAALLSGAPFQYQLFRELHKHTEDIDTKHHFSMTDGILKDVPCISEPW